MAVILWLLFLLVLMLGMVVTIRAPTLPLLFANQQKLRTALLYCILYALFCAMH